MVLNKPSGNMYEWAWTWNPVAGECKHACDYCYVQRLHRYPKLKEKYTGKIRIYQKDLMTPLTKPDDGRVVFVQSCGDLFGDFVPTWAIGQVLAQCRRYPRNIYLLQTKNPRRFNEFIQFYPRNTIFGTTLESNRSYEGTKAPSPISRYLEFLAFLQRWSGETKPDTFRPAMISVEPIMDFDVAILGCWIIQLKPAFVSIGQDSGDHHLPEPTWDKVKALIDTLELAGIDVKTKKNLKLYMHGGESR